MAFGSFLFQLQLHRHNEGVTGRSRFYEYDGHGGRVVDVKWCSDDGILATLGHDGVMCLWNPTGPG